MLKMAVNIQIKKHLKGKCPLHPRYNPESGEGRIRGGCRHCLALYEVAQARDQLHAAAARFDELTKPYEVLRKKRRQTDIDADDDSETTEPFFSPVFPHG